MVSTSPSYMPENLYTGMNYEHNVENLRLSGETHQNEGNGTFLK
jgi:hypothetical protein